MSYRLESPRPRSPLPPLRIRSPAYTPSSPTTLLYDLPQSSTRSPPPDSPKSPPLSPTRHRPLTRATPPPRSRSRSATPAQAARQELDQFAAHCHAWYFDQDEQAGQLMTQTIEALSASQRAPFSRLQASIRSKFHSTISKRRRTEFRAHLSSTHPGGSLSPASRANRRSKGAKKERFDKFDRFLRTWCISGMPGTRPFFQALWALLRLQLLPVNLGGAGSHRLEWEMDDAVLQESAGKEFMLEAIDVLKGVLAFDEYLALSASDDLPSPLPISPHTRPRSPSDPFLDTPALSHSVATYASRSPVTAPLPLADSDDLHHAEPPDPDPFLRLWSAPDLDNPELQALVSLFPDFITRHTLPRFPTTAPDLEEAVDVQCGTGRMWVGDKERGEGWQGSWWHRVAGWWRRLFC